MTTGKNLRYQQNLKERVIAIVVIGHLQWPALEPHVQRHHQPRRLIVVQQTRPDQFRPMPLQRNAKLHHQPLYRRFFFGRSIATYGMRAVKSLLREGVFTETWHVSYKILSK